jgi:hypothetical protein
LYAPGIVILLLMGGISLSWWITAYWNYNVSQTIDNIEAGMTENEVESVLGSKGKAYQVLGRYGSRRPGSRLVYWDNLFRGGDLAARTLLVEFNSDSKVANKLVLPYLMADEKAKEIPSPLAKLFAWLGW